MEILDIFDTGKRVIHPKVELTNQQERLILS
jgi:hypothetical protein